MRMPGNSAGNVKRLAKSAAIASLAMFSLLAQRADARAQQTADVPGAAASFREVTDETGRSVRIPVSARRVVSLAPSLTETVYALGLQDRLVGDTDYCDFPADARKKHKVGGAINPNLEEVASLRPDLALVTKGLNRLETVSALERLGIPAYATDPHTVEEIVASSRRLGEVLGAAEAGTSLAVELEQKLTELKQRLAGVAPKKVLFVVWTEPLISVGQHTFIADALRHAGAHSIVDSRQDWPQISLEEVVHLQPEYLVFASSHAEGVTYNVETLAKRPGWDSLEAVRQRKYVVITDAVNRTSPRIVEAIEDLARQLHPEIFAPKQEKDKPENSHPAPEQGRPPKAKAAQQEMLIKAEESACAR